VKTGLFSPVSARLSYFAGLQHMQRLNKVKGKPRNAYSGSVDVVSDLLIVMSFS
jgi:hypothetical protein